MSAARPHRLMRIDTLKIMDVLMGVLHPRAKLGIGNQLACLLLILAASSSAIADRPLTITAPEQGVYRVNRTIQLTCALGHPGLTTNGTAITWSYKGAKIANAIVEVLNSSVSQLQLQRVQFEDSGTYGCELGDGSPPALVTVQVGLPPAKPTDLQCFSRDFRFVHCTWNNGPDTNLNTTYKLEWAKETRPSNWAQCNMTLGCKPISRIECRYRVSATNVLGSDVKSKLLENFNLKEDTITSPPRLEDVIALSNSSLLVKWMPPIEYNIYPKTQKEDLVYELSWAYQDINSSWDTPETKKISGYNVRNYTHLSYAIQGLKPYALYNISLRVRYVQTVWSNKSNSKAQRTREAAPQTGVNVNLHCQPINNTTNGKTRDFELMWTPVPEYKMNGAILYYVITVNGSVCEPVSANVTKYVVEDLDSYEHYEISVVARNSVGDTDISDCMIPPLPAPGSQSSIAVIVGIPVAVSLLVILCVIASAYTYQRVKRSMIHIPDIKLPNHIHTDNLYTFGASRRFLHREQESYDELISSNLFVDLTPESESCAPSCSGVMTNGFVLERDLSKEPILEPLENHRKHPLLSARRTNSLVKTNYSQGPTEQEALLSTDTFLPDSETEKGNPPGDYPHHCGGWKDSNGSIHSGGSYMHLRDEAYTSVADGGLTPICEGGMDGSVDAQKSRPGWEPQGSAGVHNPGKLPPQDDLYPYTKMGATGGQGWPDGSSQEVPNRIRGKREIMQQPGSPKNISSTSYCDMDRIGSQTTREEPSNEDLQKASLYDIGNYVKQGLFPSPSPKKPSSRSGSPRLSCPSSTSPRDTTQLSHSPVLPMSHTDTPENSNVNPPGCCPLPSLPNQAENTVDRPGTRSDLPDVGSQNEVHPCVLNTNIIFGRAEPSQDEASPTHVSENDLDDDSDNTSSVSLSSRDGLNEHTPFMSNENNISKDASQSEEKDQLNSAADAESDASSLSGHGESTYVTVGQLLPPAKSSATSRDNSDDAIGDQSKANGTSPVVPDGSLSGGKGAEIGDYVSPEDIARWPAPKVTKEMHNDTQNDTTDAASSGKTRDSGYVTHEDLARMLVPHAEKAQGKSSQADKQGMPAVDVDSYVTQSQIKEMFKHSKGDMR